MLFHQLGKRIFCRLPPGNFFRKLPVEVCARPCFLFPRFGHDPTFLVVPMAPLLVSLSP
jgi:hypothetical protein